MITLGIVAILFVLAVAPLLFERTRSILFAAISASAIVIDRICAAMSRAFDIVFRPRPDGSLPTPSMSAFILLNVVLAVGPLASHFLLPNWAIALWTAPLLGTTLNFAVLSVAIAYGRMDIDRINGLPPPPHWAPSVRSFVGSNGVFGVATIFLLFELAALVRVINGHVPLFDFESGYSLERDVLFVLWSLPIVHQAVQLASRLAHLISTEHFLLNPSDSGSFASTLISGIGSLFIVAAIVQRIQRRTQTDRWFLELLEADEASRRKHIQNAPSLQDNLKNAATMINRFNNRKARAAISVALSEKVERFPEDFCHHLATYNSRIQRFGIEQITASLGSSPGVDLESLVRKLRYHVQRRERYRPVVQNALLGLVVTTLERMSKQPERQEWQREFIHSGFATDFVAVVAGGKSGRLRNRGAMFDDAIVGRAIRVGFDFGFEELAVRLMSNLDRDQSGEMRLKGVEETLRFVQLRTEVAADFRKRLYDAAKKNWSESKNGSKRISETSRFTGDVDTAMQRLRERLEIGQRQRQAPLRPLSAALPVGAG